MKYIVCDVDGTVADDTHRRHHVMGKAVPDWEAHFAECDYDSPIESMVHLVSLLQKKHIVVFVTGRPEYVREKTRTWLEQHFERVDHLLMRPSSSPAHCHQFKKELLLQHLPDATAENVVCVLEDRYKVVREWREAGYRTLQVEDTSF